MTRRRREAPEPTETWIDLACGCSTSELHALVNVHCPAHLHLVPAPDREYMWGRAFGRTYGPIDRPLWRPRADRERG